MKIKKNIIAFSTLAVVGALSLIAINSVSAYRGDSSLKGPNYTTERHEAMEKAFANNDYTAWKNLMGDNGGRVVQIINKDNFARFVEAHNLAEQGKITEANKIRKDLGLGVKDGSGQNNISGNRQAKGVGYRRMMR